MRNQVFFLVVLLCSIGSVSHGQNKNTGNSRVSLISKIDSILQTKVDQDEIPGSVIEIKKKDRVIYKHTYGYAQKYDYNHNVLNPPEKMTIEHMFDIASLTKVIGTTTSIMLLVDRGKISVDDPVSRYVKAFGTPDKKDITIHHLLTHT